MREGIRGGEMVHKDGVHEPAGRTRFGRGHTTKVPPRPPPETPLTPSPDREPGSHRTSRSQDPWVWGVTGTVEVVGSRFGTRNDEIQPVVKREGKQEVEDGDVGCRRQDGTGVGVSPKGRLQSKGRSRPVDSGNGEFW